SKPDYKASVAYFPYIAIIYIFRALRLFYAAPYSALKFTRPLPLTYIVVSGIKIALTVALVTKFGIYGVIASSLVSGAVEIVLLRHNLRNKFTFRYNAYKILVAPMLLFLLVIGLEPLIGNQFPLLLHLFYVVVCGGLLWWVYRHEIRLVDPFNLVR
ncbi:MAG TPA: polysaccharide biosynthesis C-terminal domain-containing protein, partial [Chryseosolibacter sp.]|nr:polysaccharide biosynthesis C-terminal domain-containing protein [Chryseosolibacter sp.]